MHYGEAIKAIMNEELGDGIMSAIDMFATIDKIKGKAGEDRIVITLNGKVRRSCFRACSSHLRCFPLCQQFHDGCGEYQTMQDHVKKNYHICTGSLQENSGL